jgi:mRNA degradation ribonuclease J1/J2
LIAGPEVRARGLAEPDGRPADESLDPVADAAEAALAGMSQKDRRDPDLVEDAVARAARRAVERRWGKKALVDAVVMVV